MQPHMAACCLLWKHIQLPSLGKYRTLDTTNFMCGKLAVPRVLYFPKMKPCRFSCNWPNGLLLLEDYIFTTPTYGHNIAHWSIPAQVQDEFSSHCRIGPHLILVLLFVYIKEALCVWITGPCMCKRTWGLYTSLVPSQKDIFWEQKDGFDYLGPVLHSVS